MKIAYINPNSTAAMTDGIVATARAAMPEAEIIGLTNASAPAAIQGKADGDAAIPGLLDLMPVARGQGADVIVIACFDDTGLAEARAIAGCPVLGIGQSSFVMAHLLGLRFSVITSLPVSIPVIEENIRDQGFSGICASVRASGLPVLTIDAGGADVVQRLADEIAAAARDDGAACAILGCAGMAHLEPELSCRSRIPLIEGVAASAHLSRVVAGG
ncbi:aspartate/glutamate racemase family protein [Primorskyibacter aestuariivivens]|uniref:aspartate/glutamate racemase family protein n=1 Tax=Primorskyibacter aestuariivivens TaxID=1888912 RepID=UPI002301BBF3|nr:aspartate/glutamate racemase family protein [Primorskyibacter aestuariivivens]MDA7428946.1 aspartate/glutamate racemase family protein [Primorskyibacter aestuariivivens]